MASELALSEEIKASFSLNGLPAQVFKPFWRDLAEFNQYFRQLMSSNVKIIDRVARYLVRHRGKQFRPALLLLSARSCGALRRESFITAVVVELLHTATLVHDDVVDDAELRRGFPTIHKIWKNKIAVLMGDYLLSKSLILATEVGSLDVMNLIATVAKRLIKGELFQLQKSRRLNITEKEYFQLIRDKTASLISACCELGALTAEAPEEHRRALRDYGEFLGLAFQIKDDMLDYEGNRFVLGKPTGLDIKEKKITLPLIYALQSASDPERKHILKLIRKGADRKKIREVIDFVRDHRGLEKARQKAFDIRDQAVTRLSVLPDSEARNALMELADFVVHRTR